MAQTEKTSPKPPIWRVRRKDDPEKWLRTFTTEDEARAFARQHAIENACNMWVTRFGDPIPVYDEWDF